MDAMDLKTIDPVRRQAELGTESTGLSPMDPPEAFAPPGLEPIPPAELHPFLRRLGEEHARLTEALDGLETVLQEVGTSGFTTNVDHAVMRFLEVFDRDFVSHSREEEAVLFPPLHQRLIDDGEHSRGETVTTAVDVMCGEHLKAVQLAAVVLNLLRVGSCLPDERSARIVIGAALREAENLIELLRLHMFREDNIVFASAQRLLSTAELDAMARR
ncbi:MAG: hemerythrin domain-containing protein [Deltaproteobacteria bacterium]|nr:hemerythrin domain-containing protein [Deltaproteobacteria bacterium]